jgi:hypothetical protein
VEFKEGDIVVVLGKLDAKVREHKQDSLTIGTLEQFLVGSQVSVLLPDGTIWVGLESLIRHESEQKS